MNNPFVAVEPDGSRWVEACREFRDMALNCRGEFEEGTLDNDQINAVLRAFDSTMGSLMNTVQDAIGTQDYFGLDRSDLREVLAQRDKTIEDRIQQLEESNGRYADASAQFAALKLKNDLLSCAARQALAWLENNSPPWSAVYEIAELRYALNQHPNTEAK